MDRLFTKRYGGEQINTVVPDDNKNYVVSEWIPKTLNFEHHGQAIVVGNGVSRLNCLAIGALVKFNASGLKGHNIQQLNSYGCNNLFKHAQPQFLVVTNHKVAKDVVDSGYIDRGGIVVTRAHIAAQYPLQMHLIPQDPQFNAGATALYLAAANGHSKVYFIGFDNQQNPSVNNNVYAGQPNYNGHRVFVDDTKWIADAADVFHTYNQTQFIRIVNSVADPIPPSWADKPNFHTITLSAFMKQFDFGLA